MNANEKTIRFFPRISIFIGQTIVGPILSLIALVFSMNYPAAQGKLAFGLVALAIVVIDSFLLVYSLLYGWNTPIYMDKEKAYRRIKGKTIVWYWKDMQDVYVRQHSLFIPSARDPFEMVIKSLNNVDFVFEPTNQNIRKLFSVCGNEDIRNRIQDADNGVHRNSMNKVDGGGHKGCEKQCTSEGKTGVAEFKMTSAELNDYIKGSAAKIVLAWMMSYVVLALCVIVYFALGFIARENILNAVVAILTIVLINAVIAVALLVFFKNKSTNEFRKSSQNGEAEYRLSLANGRYELQNLAVGAKESFAESNIKKVKKRKKIVVVYFFGGSSRYFAKTKETCALFGLNWETRDEND